MEYETKDIRNELTVYSIHDKMMKIYRKSGENLLKECLYKPTYENIGCMSMECVEETMQNMAEKEGRALTQTILL